MVHAGMFWIKTAVVRNTQRREIPIFLQNSPSITSSVSQLAYSVPTGKALLEKFASATICFTLFMAGIHSDGLLNNLCVSSIEDSKTSVAASPQTRSFIKLKLPRYFAPDGLN